MYLFFLRRFASTRYGWLLHGHPKSGKTEKNSTLFLDKRVTYWLTLGWLAACRISEPSICYPDQIVMSLFTTDVSTQRFYRVGIWQSWRLFASRGCFFTSAQKYQMFWEGEWIPQIGGLTFSLREWPLLARVEDSIPRNDCWMMFFCDADTDGKTILHMPKGTPIDSFQISTTGY